MKAKILSMLLLVAMLITAVPVMVSAEEAATESEQIQQATNNEATADTTPGDLHDWYVQDGLTALYTAFGANNGVDLTNGTWANRVKNGESAVLNGTYWTVGTDNIGYRLTYSEFKSYAQNVSVMLPNSYAEFDNFTVETLANVIGITDENGDRYINNYVPAVKDEAGNEVTPASGAQHGVFKTGNSAFRFDMLTALFFASYDKNTKAQSITTRWYLMNSAYAGSDPNRDPSDGKLAAISVSHWESGWSVSAVDEYKINAMQVTKTTDTTDTETYTVAYNNVAKATKAMTAEERALIEAANAAEASRFQLFHGVPADVYSIRVYDRALTISEMRQNRAVDILLYYGIALDASVVANAAAQKAVCGAIYDFEIVTDATAKAAKKAELETLVAKALENAKIIGLYAAPESMTSFFTIYVPDSINLTTGKWADLIGGDAAKMQTPSRWFVNADGSFGYNVFVGWIDADGKANQGLDPKRGWTVNSDQAEVAALGNVPTANHAYYKNNALTFDMNKLPAEDFTVEYLAKYRPFLVADAAKSTKDQIVYAKDAEGNLIEAYNLFGTTPATTDYGYPSPRSMDAFGHFTVVTQRVDSTSGWGSSVRGTQHYMYKCHHWVTGSQRNWLGSGSWGATSGLALKGDAYKQNDVINLYTITLDETKDESGALSANFGLYRNAALYNQSNGVITWSDTAPSKTYTGELASNAEFYLSAGQPTDFYAVRVYNKALTAAEKAQNLGADVILYYGIELDDKTLANKELVEAILASASVVKIETDETAKGAALEQLKAAIADATNRLAVMTLDGTLYVTKNLTSLFTAFGDTTKYTVAEDGSNKIWVNRANNGNATFKGSIWTIGANGGVGKTYIRGTTQNGEFVLGTDKDGNPAWQATNNSSTPNTSITNDYALHLGLDLLPNDDYTVEYLAYFPPMYAVDVDTGERTAHYKGNYTEEGYRVDMYGFLEFDSVWPGGAFDGINNYIRGRLGDAGLKAWGGASGGKTYGFGSLNFKIDKRDTLKVDTYGVYRDETTVMDGDTVVEVKANYGTLYNTTVSHKLTNFSTAYTALGGHKVSDTEMKEGKYYFGDDTGRDFYLSKTAGATFYALRIYDRVLTQAEREQNRMADVLYYYGIELTAEQKADEKLIAYLTATALTTALEQDATAKATNKAALEEKIATFVKTVTIQVGSVVLGTLEVFGDMLTLPTLVNGKFVIGWRVDGVEGNVAPGTSVTVTGDVTATPTVLTPPATSTTQSVKVTETAEELGVRFTATLSRAEYMMLIELYGSDNIKLGMLITPDAYVQKAGGVFTREALRTMVDDSPSRSGAAYVEVAADGFYRVEENILTVAGSIYNFKDNTYARNPEFAAVAFIDVDTDADGMTDFTVYGSYDQKASANVKDTMTGARENMTNTQKEWIDSLLKKFGA